METTVVFVDPYEEADEEVCWILFVVFVTVLRPFQDYFSCRWVQNGGTL